MTDFIIHLAVFLPLINLGILLYLYKGGLPELRAFALYQGIILCIDWLNTALAWWRINNLLLSHCYFIGQFLLLSRFYYILFKSGPQKRLLITTTSLITILNVINLSLFTKNLFAFSHFEVFTCSFPIIVYAAIHFYNMLDGDKRFYYSNAGVMAYIFGSTVIFLSGNLINELKINDDYIRITNSLMYIGYQVLIFVDLKKSYLRTRNAAEVSEI